MAVDVWHFTDSPGFGGAEIAMLRLAERLDGDRWRSTIVHHALPGLNPLVECAERAGIRTLVVEPMPDGVAGAWAARAFRRTLRTARPAILHANLTWPLAAKYPRLAAVMARTPVVATVHLYPRIRPRISARVQHRLLARGVHHVAVSHAIADRLVAELGWPPGRVEVVHNGIDGRRYDAVRDAEVRRSLTSDVARKLVVCIARLANQKGLPHLVEAMQLLPDVSLAIAGDGPDREALKAFATGLAVGDRVRFLGRRHDVPRLLSAADVFVLPSLWEGLPLSLVEAMAAHVPIVATAIAGIEEAVTDGESALLVPPADPAALARAIRRILDDPETAGRLAAAAAARQSAHFSLDTMVGRIEAIYEALVPSRLQPA
jgi:glycosyltransferase involved in cell wall biosynthesis